MSQLPPVIILDLDDTVIDFTGMSEECWRVICHEEAGTLGVDGGALHATLLAERVRFWADPELNRIGRSALVEASRRILVNTFGVLGVNDHARAATMAESYRARRDLLVCLFPDSISTLEMLRARGHRLAMLTNGSTESQRGKITRFNLARHFDYIQVEGEFGHGKPDERVYRHLLERLVVQPTDALMIGDDLERDVAGPQRAGMQGVWIDRVGAGLPANTTVCPDRIITALSDLL